MAPRKTSNNKASGKAKPKKLATDKVANASHIIKKTYSNGKTLLNSNGKPTNFQVAIDAEIDKWLTKENTKRNSWGTQIEPVSAPNMRSDFEAMGFDSAKVGAMMGTRETLKVDGCTQRPAVGSGKCVPNTGPLPVKKTRKPKGKGKYEALKIWADQRKFPPLSKPPLSLGTHSLTPSQHGSSSTRSKATPSKAASLPPPSPHWSATSLATPASSCSTRRTAASCRKPRPPLSGTAASTTPTSVPGSRAGHPSEAAGSSSRPSQSQREQQHQQHQRQRQQSALSSAAAPSATPRAPRRLPRRPSPLPPLQRPARSASPIPSRR
jgi:hypothetical protein